MPKSPNHWLHNRLFYCLGYFLSFFFSTILVNLLLNNFDINHALEASAFGLLFTGPIYFIILTILVLIVSNLRKESHMRSSRSYIKLGMIIGSVPITLSLILYIFDQ